MSHLIAKSKSVQHNNNLFVINFHQREGRGSFSENESLIRFFQVDNACLKSASQSSLFLDFVFIFTSAERSLSHG